MQDQAQTPEPSYNYDLQCWIINGIVEPCGHATKIDSCTACHCAGMTVLAATIKHKHITALTYL